MKFVRNLIAKLYRWYGKKTVIIVAIVVVVLIAVGLFLATRSTETAPVTSLRTKEVVVRQVSELTGGSLFSAVGVVTAVSEARLQTESSGRVTSVSVGIGDRVTAGQILAQLENASERAALLQAEGAYESALVGGEQAGISLDEARTSALNTYRISFTAADDTIRNLTDELFSNPTTQSVGLRVDGQGQALRLNEERVALGTVLENWGINVSAGTSVDPQNALNTAEEDLTRIGAFVSDLAFLVSEQDENDEFTADVIASYKVRLSAARSRIDGAIQAISGARNALLQAEQSAQGGAVSSEADARIKQALGGLRAAQAAYERTLVRTPISGVVNAFYLTANQYVPPSAPAAIVANNVALEIKTSISEKDRNNIAIGDAVVIGNTSTGTITRIAPAVDPTTGKIEVRIGVEDGAEVQSGDTVSIHFTRANAGDTNEPLVLPIAAFKITSTGPVAFTVGQDGTLVANPVVLGAITGDTVVVEDGLALDMDIVSDARGLKAGEKVSVTAN